MRHRDTPLQLLENGRSKTGDAAWFLWDATLLAAALDAQQQTNLKRSELVDNINQITACV